MALISALLQISSHGSICMSAHAADESATAFEVHRVSDELNEVEGDDAKRARLLIRRADLYFSTKEYEKSERDFRDSISLKTDSHLEAQCRLSRLLIAETKYDEAKSCVEELEHISGMTARSRATQAVLYLLRHQSQPSIDAATQSIKLDPNYGYAYYVRGVANLEAGNPTEALHDLDLAIELNPTVSANEGVSTATLFLNRSQAMDLLDRRLESTQALRNAFLAEPDSFETVLHYANRQMNDGYFEAASEKAAKAKLLSPDSVLAIRLAMNCYNMTGDVDRTVEFAEEWVKKEPKSFLARQTLCKALVKSGNGRTIV